MSSVGMDPRAVERNSDSRKRSCYSLARQPKCHQVKWQSCHAFTLQALQNCYALYSESGSALHHQARLCGDQLHAGGRHDESAARRSILEAVITSRIQCYATLTYSLGIAVRQIWLLCKSDYLRTKESGCHYLIFFLPHCYQLRYEGWALLQLDDKLLEAEAKFIIL